MRVDLVFVKVCIAPECGKETYIYKEKLIGLFIVMLEVSSVFLQSVAVHSIFLTGLKTAFKSVTPIF